MSENKAKIISQKIEVSKPYLWLIWFFLFVFPSILSLVGFNYFRNEYLYFSKTDLINQAFDNIRAYNELIAPENYLEYKIKKIKELALNNSPDIAKKEIDKYLCGETLFCVFFKKTTDKVTIIKSDKSKNLSINFLKKYISELIRSYSNSSETKSFASIDDSQKQLASALQSLFKTITPVTINRNNVSKNFSVLKGGELYFIFFNIEKANSEYRNIFAVMKGEDFSFRKMLQNLNERFPEIKIVFKKIDINRTRIEEENGKELIIHSGIKTDKNIISITAPASLIFSRHVLHDGKEELNKKYGNLIPFIEYKIPINKVDSNLRKLEKGLYTILILLVFISSLYLLHINLFGFNPNQKFKTKMLILTMVASFFPFAVFSVGFYSIENFNRFMLKTYVQQVAEIELHFNNQELNQYLSLIEDKINRFGLELNEILNDNELKPSVILGKLSSIKDTIPLSKEVLYLDPVPDKLKLITTPDDPHTIVLKFSEKCSKELLEEQNESILNEIPSRIIKLANQKIKTRDRENYFTIRNEKIESNELSDMFQNDGKLVPLSQLVTSIWYSNQQIYKKNTNEVIGVFLAKFESRPILHFFYKDSNYSNLVKNNFKTTMDNYEIDYAFIPVEKSGTAEIWKGSGKIDEEDKILCLKNPQSGIINLKGKTLIKKQNLKIPHLAIATVKELVPFNQKDYIVKIIILIIIYLFFLFLFTNKLIDIVFLKPVKLLADNASAIAKGSENWDTVIYSGDEFEDLNNNFKNLVTGLKERNILKSYVSEDAFSDIKESNETNLKPGGEYMEATIIFSAIKDYDKLSKTISPEESIKLLSKFMSIAEEVSKKYNGSIDKIIGDTIMIVFRNNTSLPSHALRAAQASLELVEKANEANLPKLYTGIASGKVISGKIGSYSGKLDFTVIGNPVNSAARFKAESKNGTEQTGIIISGTTIGLTKGKAKVKFLRRVAIKGKSRKYNIYELIGIRKDEK